MNALPPKDPFAPLTEEERQTATSRPDDAQIWEPVSPAPSEPERPPSALAMWVYRDAEGRPLCARFRVDRPDGGKDIIPLTYGHRVWTDSKGVRRDETGWHWKQGRRPLPLYGLDRLAERPDAPVLLVEGEKTAEAVGRLFPDYVGMTSPGGSNAARNADWSPLAGRAVTIWPDNDDAGGSYTDAVIDALKEAGAASVRRVRIPDGLPEGWDIADAVPDELTDSGAVSDADFLRPFLDRAPMAQPDVKMPPGYSMTASGLYFTPETEGDLPATPRWVSAPFEVLAETCDENSNEWGLMIAWQDGRSHRHQWTIPKKMVHGEGRDLTGPLEGAGLNCSISGARHLRQFIASVRTTRRLRCVSKSGWHSANGHPVFVLPNGKTFGTGGRDVTFQTPRLSTGAEYSTAGTLADWQRDIARYAVGNSRLAFALSVAFTGPLLDIMGEQSGGFHIVGDSQTGKSTALFAAGSVWGKGDRDGQVRSWRGTSNGVEGIAERTSDTLLLLDEMGQADSREVGDTIYMLGNGTGKQRAGRDGEARERKNWRSLFLSTGELTLADKMRDAGKRAMAGQEARLVTVRADAGAGMGLFERLHDLPSPGALADHLRNAARTSYGTASRAFLEALVRDREEDEATLADTIRRGMASFEGHALPEGGPVDGQVRSVVRRFGLVATAGELATTYGVLPWKLGEATGAALACFRSWLDERGGTGSAEDRAAIVQVRLFIEQHGESRFQTIGAGTADARTIINRAGFRRRSNEGWEYLFFPGVWKAEVCKGLDARRVARTLADAGLLKPDDSGKLSRLIKDPDEKKPVRAYLVKDDIMGGAE